VIDFTAISVFLLHIFKCSHQPSSARPILDNNVVETRQTLDKLDDLVMLLLGLTLLDQVDLVLHDQYVFQLHNLDGGQVLGRLWLWTRLIASWTRAILSSSSPSSSSSSSPSLTDYDNTSCNKKFSCCRDRAMLCVTEYFAKSLKVIQNDTVEYGRC